MEITSSSRFCQQPLPGDQRLHKHSLPTSPCCLCSACVRLLLRRWCLLSAQLLFQTSCLQKLRSRCYLFSALAWLCRDDQVSRQAVGSPTHFLLDGDIKYLLSEVFAAAPLQLTASTKMLRKGVGELLCPHSLLSFAMVTQKFLGFVALLLSVSDGQHNKIYDGFPFGSTILDLPTCQFQLHTRQLFSSQGTVFSYTTINSEKLKDSP